MKRENRIRHLTVFHYHLKPGGVTSVILLGMKALMESPLPPEKITVVSGSGDNLEMIRRELEPPARKNRVTVSVVHHPDTGSLDDPENPGRRETGERGRLLAEKLREQYGDGVWWIHNHHLGKNPLFTQAVLKQRA